ncbi:STAS domain-containing protein [Candidatus Bathyarchaeota archaeon]|nr:STAS domain-containing protein [Candidatus Bathyarchaeota archaeon]
MESELGQKTPLVEIWDNIILVPVIGILDTHRAEKLSEELLQKIVEEEAKFVIIDIAGVEAMDTRVVKHLIDIIKALKLMGSNAVISGMRPDVAKTLVGLDVVFQVPTFNVLRRALHYTFNQMNLKVVNIE